VINNPDPDSKQPIFGTCFSTLIPRGFHGDRKSPDMPITSPFQRNKPRIPPGQKEGFEKKFLDLDESPACQKA
jgi:hypothetical protein